LGPHSKHGNTHTGSLGKSKNPLLGYRLVMGFYFKVAPGVRLKVSSRGVRAGIGPRVARVHVGSGRPGVSTGFGPAGIYAPLSGRRRPTKRRTASRTPTRTSVAAQQRQLAKAQKAQDARAILQVFVDLAALHRATFPSAKPLDPPSIKAIDEAEIRSRCEAEALEGIGRLKHSARSDAKRRGAEEADRQIEAERARAISEHDQAVADCESQWNLLCENDPEEVQAALTEAFDDNESFAVPVNVQGNEVSIVLVCPGIDLIPEKMPELSSAGNIVYKKLTKAQLSDWYVIAICGSVLTTVREAFAVAPAIEGVQFAAIRVSESDAYGHHRPECLMAMHFERARLEGVDWNNVDGVRIVNDVATDIRHNRSGQAKVLTPLDLSQHADLAELVGAIDVDDL
jgi:hypothetical protein